MDFDLNTALESIDLPAEWIGLREVRETSTTRYVRDGKPQANGRNSTHGVMIEVLAQGQFGYASTNRLDRASLELTAESAFNQAIAASKWSLDRFTTMQRPKAVGQYYSPFLLSSQVMSGKEDQKQWDNTIRHFYSHLR